MLTYSETHLETMFFQQPPNAQCQHASYNNCGRVAKNVVTVESLWMYKNQKFRRKCATYLSYVQQYSPVLYSATSLHPWFWTQNICAKICVYYSTTQKWDLSDVHWLNTRYQINTCDKLTIFSCLYKIFCSYNNITACYKKQRNFLIALALSNSQPWFKSLRINQHFHITHLQVWLIFNKWLPCPKELL